ncbi:hypothetical protein K2P47_02210 [Patescibacteria group bacterium]|nr:hypothetical protein [Patescibacteria group bacterium]
MIESKDIKKMVQHILRRDKGIADTQIMHPTREWFTGLAITLGMVVLGSWFCYYLYSFHHNEMKKEVVIIEQAVPYQAATVKSALEVFATKQEKYNEILGGGMNDIPVSVATTTTPVEVSATSTEEIPELIVDPAPIFEDDGTPIEATLTP